MTDSDDQARIEPFQDADGEAGVPSLDSPSPTDEAAGGNLGLHGAAASGALSGSVPTIGGGSTGAGGAIAAQLTTADDGDDEPLESVGPTEVAGPDDPDA